MGIATEAAVGVIGQGVSGAEFVVLCLALGLGPAGDFWWGDGGSYALGIISNKIKFSTFFLATFMNNLLVAFSVSFLSTKFMENKFYFLID